MSPDKQFNNPIPGLDNILQVPTTEETPTLPQESGDGTVSAQETTINVQSNGAVTIPVTVKNNATSDEEDGVKDNNNNNTGGETVPQIRKKSAEVICIIEALGELLTQLELGTENGINPNVEKRRLEQLVQGYMSNASVIEIKETLDFYGFLNSLEQLATNHPCLHQDKMGTTINPIELSDRTVYVFIIPAKYKAYSPYVPVCSLTANQAEKVVEVRKIGQKYSLDDMLCGEELPRLPTQYCTIVLHKQFGLSWCAGFDPKYFPPKDEATRWVKCGKTRSSQMKTHGPKFSKRKGYEYKIDTTKTSSTAVSVGNANSSNTPSVAPQQTSS